MLAKVTSRSEAQVIRLALIYALLDQSHVILLDHLHAALAVWDYCEQSAKIIFGDKLGDPIADKILDSLKKKSGGLTLTEIQKLFSNNKKSSQIEYSLSQLRELNQVQSKKIQTGGRPTEKWFLQQ